jgi:hypothetical protein
MPINFQAPYGIQCALSSDHCISNIGTERLRCCCCRSDADGPPFIAIASQTVGLRARSAELDESKKQVVALVRWSPWWGHEMCPLCVDEDLCDGRRAHYCLDPRRVGINNNHHRSTGAAKGSHRSHSRHLVWSSFDDRRCICQILLPYNLIST